MLQKNNKTVCNFFKVFFCRGGGGGGGGGELAPRGEHIQGGGMYVHRRR